MKLRTILAAFAVMASGSLYAQNATKADLDKLTNQVNELSQRMTELESKATQFETKVAQLEADVERIVTENVNLVEQLNIKTVTSMIDNKNGITIDIVKVEPNASTNEVVISLRFTNNSGTTKTITTNNTEWFAYDSDSNKSDNSYRAWDRINKKLDHGIPVNATVTFEDVPTTCSYLSLVNGIYQVSTAKMFETFVLKFTGVHIPW